MTRGKEQQAEKQWLVSLIPATLAAVGTEYTFGDWNKVIALRIMSFKQQQQQACTAHAASVLLLTCLQNALIADIATDAV